MRTPQTMSTSTPRVTPTAIPTTLLLPRASAYQTNKYFNAVIYQKYLLTTFTTDVITDPNWLSTSIYLGTKTQLELPTISVLC